ncbi:MAG TPA: hypothetical protein VMI75_03740 [Polyangiaceae bacterium]|nr:hypothetical protein [Polyangiaceae bacterium]
MSVRLGLAAVLVGVAGCGAPSAPPVQSPPVVAETPQAPSAELPPTAQPDVDLREPGAAIVHGSTRVAFDGIAEGLAWPALDKALGPRKAGDVLTVQVARALPTIELLRAAWTLRQADLRVQSQDATGDTHVVVLSARRDGAAPAGGCHLAVFLRPDGSLRVASPGGPVSLSGDDPPASLARSLEEARRTCAIRYVAFGAESDASPWGPVFDVIRAVDRAKSAGDTRYVLGQAMHTSAQAQ